jgi:uncharacterized protein with NRDE domain
MCLIVFAWQVVPGTPLIVAANRDEFYDRPALPAGWWDDHPQVYAGRDLRGGGTWLGITKNGRFAAITSVRAPAEKLADAPSRGELAARFLTGQASPQEYITEIAGNAGRYNGFNLLVGNRAELIWFSNGKKDDPRNGKPLTAGVYGLSNDALDSPWPKVVRTKAQFASLLCQGAPQDAFFEMLTDTTRASDCRLPKTGVNLEMERLLSAVLIESPNYGTRTSTVVQLHADNTAELTERAIR